MATVNEAGRPILLGGYDAKRCAVRVHHDNNRLVPKTDWVPTPEERARMDAGNSFEADVFAALRALHPQAVLIDPGLRGSEAVAATLGAMDTEAPLILGGWLPDDVEGGRKGKPDILIRFDDGYIPADVKNHATLQSRARTRAVVSTLAEPAERTMVSGWSSAGPYRFEDGLQLAHYTRMLQSCGRHGGPRVGAILGTSAVVLDDREPQTVLVWHDLEEQVITTFSRSRGTAKRSLLERYDHEHGFRVRVAANARMMSGSPDDPPPLVDPIGQEECGSCPYGAWCADLLGEDDPSMQITIGRLGVREWLALRGMGVSTTAELSALDLDDDGFLDAYLPEVAGTRNARGKLAAAVRRAQMICEGIEIARTGFGPVVLPVADVEVDLDVEFDRNNRVYLWGVRIRSGAGDSSACYLDDFIAWDPLDDEGERALARRFAGWLQDTLRTAAAEDRTVRVYHWSHPEASQLRRILGAANVGELINEYFIDLEKVFKDSFFSLHGSKLKVVAPIFGFSWQVADPGGATSQLYLDAIHTGAEPGAVAAAQRWLLSYNHDDTAATAVIRDGMRGWVG